MLSGNELIGSLVYRTQNKLRENHKFIAGLNDVIYTTDYFRNGEFCLMYYPGTVSEIKNGLMALDNSQKTRNFKYPACFNYLPRIEVLNWPWWSITFNIAFAARTNKDWWTDQREKYVFDPVLRPIYHTFMEVIDSHPRIRSSAVIENHRKIEVFTTGEVSPSTLVSYPDWIDAIEIQSLTLKIKDCDTQYDVDYKNEYKQLFI